MNHRHLGDWIRRRGEREAGQGDLAIAGLDKSGDRDDALDRHAGGALAGVEIAAEPEVEEAEGLEGRSNSDAGRAVHHLQLGDCDDVVWEGVGDDVADEGEGTAGYDEGVVG